MRVLIASRGVVALRPGCGGAELAAYQLAKHVAREGVEITFVSDVQPGFPDVPGLRIVPLSSKVLYHVRRMPGTFFHWLLQHLVGNVVTVLAVRRELRRNGPFDVVHVHGNLAALLVSRLTSVPVVYTEHDATPWSCRYRHPVERVIRKLIYLVVNGLAYRSVDCVVPVFDSLGAEIVERWGIDPAKVVPITNGTDLDLFNPERDGTSLVRERAGFDRYCLFIGSLTPRKAPDFLLRSVAATDGLACAFVGDGAMRERLTVLADELGVRDRVAFLGAVAPQHLARIYADAEFFVLPSLSEGTPLVLAESLACGTPVISTDIAGTPTIARHDETGLLVPPGDQDALTAAIQTMHGDPDLRRRLGEAGQELVRRTFVWPLLARQYAAVYHELAAGSPSRAVVTDAIAVGVS